MVASSVVWKYTSKIIKNNKEYYKCNVGSCQHEAVFAGTVAIKNHLKGHDDVKLTEEEEDNKKEEDSNKNKTKLASKELLYFIVSGFLPFRIVDNFHFQRFLKIIASNYKLPSRNHISNTLLEIQFKEVCAIIKNDLAGAISIAATTDIWTSCQNFNEMNIEMK